MLFEAFFNEDKKQKSKLKASSYFGTIPKFAENLLF